MPVSLSVENYIVKVSKLFIQKQLTVPPKYNFSVHTGLHGTLIGILNTVSCEYIEHALLLILLVVMGKLLLCQ